ncbi:hypothetical protein M877_04085 [Streptomyces niveus NCIMB 11891]|nr:hypothetical protein M877_04085 [Streptomyces niveus NCIMB 11891]
MPGTVLTDGSSPSNGATTGCTLSTSSAEASGATGTTGTTGTTGGRATGPDDASGVPLPGTDAAACR